MSLARKAAILFCAALALPAAPTLTTIQDTIYKADGTKFTGIAVISWTPFDADDSSKIGLQSLTVKITNGAFRVQLVPNSDASPVNNYNVQYSSDGSQSFTEFWSVPPSTTPLRIKDVRLTTSTSGTGSGGSGSTGGGVVQPPSQSPITESNVTGLLTDLSLRPTKGAAYTTGRAAMVNDSGSIDSVEGNLSDCVHVDGSSGACIDTSYLPVFVDFETPGGVVDGSNASFTLVNTPAPAASLLLYRNGLLQQAGSDYNIQSDGSILFVPAAVPQPGDVLLASYRTGDLSSSIVMAPQSLQSSVKVQVLCSGAGATTSSQNLVVLGSCTIPASALAVGDRVEVRFNFAHQGTGSGFKFQVNWGHTAMVQRIAYTQDALVTGHGDASVSTAGTTLDMQSWGTSLALGTVVAPASDAITSPIVVQFEAGLSAASTDTVSLQNYTILRYPAQ
jgi:hypothetical protein